MGDVVSGLRTSCGTLNEAWYVVARSSELRSTPLSRTVMDAPLAVFRDDTGQARALTDRCAHRNAALSGGRVVDGCLQCPYHGWTYDGAGARVRVPSEGPERAQRPGRAVESFAVREQGGLVWVWMGRSDPPEGAEPYAFEPDGDGWGSYFMVTEFAGGVTDLVENFMDVPHTAFVHAGWFRRAKKAKPATALVERTAASVCVTYDQPDDAIGAFDRMLNPTGLPMVHTDRFFAPHVTRVDYLWGELRGLVISSQITPITATRAVVYTKIAYRFGWLNPLLRVLLPPYTRAVIRQDVSIMANQTANLTRFGGRAFSGTEADVVHRAIEMVLDHRAAGEQGPAPGRQTTTIRFWM